MPYQLGVTPANMVELEDLTPPIDDPLWQPLSDWSPFSGTKMQGTGAVVGTGRPVFAWRFNELTLEQMGALLYYVSEAGVLVASRTVYVRTRVPDPNMTDRVFQSYQAIMLHPFEPGEARYGVNRFYNNVNIRFIQAVEI